MTRSKQNLSEAFTGPADTRDTCSLNGFNFAEWVVAPEARAAVATMHGMANAMLDEKSNVRELRTAYRHYTAYLAQIGMMPRGYAKASTTLIEETRTARARAMFNQMNCQTLRFLAGQSSCGRDCCCRCPAAHKNVTACIEDVPPRIMEIYREEMTKRWEEGAA